MKSETPIKHLVAPHQGSASEISLSFRSGAEADSTSATNFSEGDAMHSTSAYLKTEFSGRRHASRLPLVVRTVEDVKVLRNNSRAVRRLPAGGVIVAFEGLDEDIAQTLKASSAAYIRSCGCGEGGAFALIAFIGVLVFFTIRIVSRGVSWSDLGLLAGGLLLAVLAGGLGKVIGLTIARLRFKRSCDAVISRMQ